LVSVGGLAGCAAVAAHDVLRLCERVHPSAAATTVDRSGGTPSTAKQPSAEDRLAALLPVAPLAACPWRVASRSHDSGPSAHQLRLSANAGCAWV